MGNKKKQYEEQDLGSWGFTGHKPFSLHGPCNKPFSAQKTKKEDSLTTNNRGFF